MERLSAAVIGYDRFVSRRASPIRQQRSTLCTASRRGENESWAGDAPTKIPLKESGSRLPPGCLPTPNARSGDIFRELQRRSPGRYQPLQIRTHEQRHAENTSLPGTETFEEQWQEEVIRGPFPVPISPAERTARNALCQLNQTAG